MYRVAMEYLREWKEKRRRKPLLLRGARQVGKTYLVREFGKKYFSRVVEINFEFDRGVCSLFESSYDPERVLRYISSKYGVKVDSDTLLFFDEVQECPQALVAMRYFYERIPEVYLIGAGSLLEFAIEEVGIPVGRIRSLYLYPMSFYEFLIAKGKEGYVEMLMESRYDKPVEDVIHNDLIGLLGEYLAVGGMPEAVSAYIESGGDFVEVRNVHRDIIGGFRQDFYKYGRKQSIKYIDKVFDAVPLYVGEKFVYSKVDEYLKIRDIRQALEVLAKAGIVYKVYHSSVNGVPLGAWKNYKRFKVIFMDIGLSQTMLGEDRAGWFVTPAESISLRGNICENFVGMELLSYADPFVKKELYYWVREKVYEREGRRKRRNAEVDYVEVINGEIVPIEVKAGKRRYSKSLDLFLEEKGKPWGIVFSGGNFENRGRIRVVPLYAVFKLRGSLGS